MEYMSNFRIVIDNTINKICLVYIIYTLLKASTEI